MSDIEKHIAAIIEAGKLIDDAGKGRDGFQQFAELERLLSYMLPHAEAALDGFMRLRAPSKRDEIIKLTTPAREVLTGDAGNTLNRKFPPGTH